MAIAERIIHREHRNMFSVISCLRGMARGALNDAKPLDVAVLRQALDYVERFLNTCHHPKESAFLFARLRERRPELLEVLDGLDAQHASLPGKLAEMRAALDRYDEDPAGERAPLCAMLEQYCQFELEHMRREEADVLPAARDGLTAEDWQAIDEAFGDNDDPLFGKAQSASLRLLFQRLVNEIPAPHGLGNPSG